MTDPRNQDDSWGELYRELGVDDPDTSKAPHGSVEEDIVAADETEVIELIESDSDEIGEPAQAFDDVGDEETVESEFESVEGESEAGEGEGEPGQKKRRRRRRRRKKKGGVASQTGDESIGGDFEGEESETQLENDYEGPEAITGPGVEDEVTPEMTRDIIANWNVPSWEEIVTGLYRPDR
jgi:hypothetical protein